jgi:uncharacterized protein YkwD
MGLNIIDWLLILVFLLSIAGGYKRGFILSFTEIACWISSLVLAFLSYPFIVEALRKEGGFINLWAAPLAFLGSFIIFRIILNLVMGRLVALLPADTHKFFLNRALGIFPGAFNGLIYAALIATFLLIFPISDKVSANAEESKLAGRLTEPVSKVEEKLSPIFHKPIQETIGRLTIDPHSEKFIHLPYKLKNAKERPDLEEKMLVLINEERIKSGLKPLKADPEMRVVAIKHSADMFARGYFSHQTPEKKDPFDRMKDEHVSFLTAGENLALARNLNMAHEGLMNSPGHRANILHPAFRRVGIGILDGGIRGIMVTQNFRN